MKAGSPISASRALPFRLSMLMFLQWSVPAAMVPLLSVRLERDLGFSANTTAIICATQTVAGVVSSLLAGQVADRWLSAERALTLCAAVAGVALWALAELHQPHWVFLAVLVFGLVNGPMSLFGTTISFAHLPHPREQFGPIRLWGTVGWMVVGWLILVWPGDPMRLGGVIALTLAAYSLTLPRTPPRTPLERGKQFAPWEAIQLLKRPTFAIYCVCLLGACVTFPFTTQNTPLLLVDLGVPRRWLTATMTVSQTTEVLSLAALPLILRRLGVRGAMVMGLVAWLIAMVVLAVGQPTGLVIASLALNGLFVTGFLITGQVYVNSLADDDFRASVQGLFSCINGLGGLSGHLLAGWLRQRSGGDVAQTFVVAAVLTAGLLILFLAGFRQPQRQESEHGKPAGEGVGGPP